MKEKKPKTPLHFMGGVRYDSDLTWQIFFFFILFFIRYVVIIHPFQDLSTFLLQEKIKSFKV